MLESVIAVTAMVLLGVALGVVFYGGLWLTLRRLPTTRHPYLLTMGSLFARIAVVLGGLWLGTAGEPWAIAAASAGFVTVQLLAAARVSMGRTATKERSVS